MTCPPGSRMQNRGQSFLFVLNYTTVMLSCVLISALFHFHFLTFWVWKANLCISMELDTYLSEVRWTADHSKNKLAKKLV